MITNPEKRPRIIDIVKPDEIITKYGKQYAKYDKIYEDYVEVNPENYPNQKDYISTRYHKFSSYYNSEYGTTTEVVEYYTTDSSDLNYYLRYKRWFERGKVNKKNLMML